MDAEDGWQFVYDLITQVAEVGHIVGQIQTSGFEPPWDGAQLTAADLARAVAALLRKDLVRPTSRLTSSGWRSAGAAYAKQAAKGGEAVSS